MDAIAAAAGLASLDTRSLDLLVQRLRAVAGLLRDLVAAVGRATPPGWSGMGRRAYNDAAVRVKTLLASQAGVLDMASLALATVSATLLAVQAEEVQSRRILGVGMADARPQVGGQLGQAIQAFNDADQRAATLLIDLVLGAPLTGRSGAPALSLGSRAAELVRDTTRPRRAPDGAVAVSLWWAGLPVASQAAYESESWFFGRPQLPGAASLSGLDGMPSKVRDAMNRVRLGAALRSAQRELAHGEHELLHAFTAEMEDLARRLPWPLSWISKSLLPDLERPKARVRALLALTRELKHPGSELLLFDAKGDGRAVVATGDLDSSPHVAVLVPGMSSELDNVPRLVDESVALAGAAGAGSVVVAWLGYDAPSVLQVASDAKAKTGAVELRSFTGGVRATAAVRQRLTVIGHSYGTLVAGLAARKAPAADDLVLLASPGVEASSATQLKVPAGHVWAARAATDPIQVVFWPAQLSRLLGLPAPLVFGPDPTSAAFGASHLGVGGAYGHSGYFTAGSQSLRNLGRIISGGPAS